MKRGLVIGIIFILVMISFISAECTDSDGGLNYDEKGTINLSNQNGSGDESDKCTGIGEGISELVCGSDGCGYSVVYPTTERKNPQYMLIYDNGGCNQATAMGGYTYDCSVEGKICSKGKCVESTIEKCIPNWECSEWSSCMEFEGQLEDGNVHKEWNQVRDCIDKNDCSTMESKPDVVKSCKETFCRKYYSGIEFDNFCFTDFEKTVFENPKAENGILKYTPYNSNTERTIEYPNSIKIVDFGVNFSIKINLENKGNSEEKIRLYDFKMFVFDTESIDYDNEFTLGSGEIKEFIIPITLPNSNARTGVNKQINFYDNQETIILPRIIFYWDYNPFSEVDIEVKQCGNKKYNENLGVCLDDIFFPAIEGFSCTTDNDCLNYDSTTPEFKCFEHSCLVMSGTYNIGSKDKGYKVGVLPLYLTDDDNQYIKMKVDVENQFNTILPKMNKWLIDEKSYWNVDNNFLFDYFLVEEGCKMNYSQFEEIHPVSGNMKEDELREIEEKCVSNQNYDILIISIQRDDNFPNFIGAGINYQTIMASALSPRTIIHELLHSFGEHDLYGVESYQWGNCYLYNANTGGNWDENMPHLCKFEAMQLSWIDKYPNGKITTQRVNKLEPTEETGPIEIPKEVEPEQIDCNGCKLDNKCYPFGYRKSGEYCSDNLEFIEYSEQGNSCENNFECKSNVCVSGECVSEGLIKKILNWFKRLFGGE